MKRFQKSILESSSPIEAYNKMETTTPASELQAKQIILAFEKLKFCKNAKLLSQIEEEEGNR